MAFEFIKLTTIYNMSYIVGKTGIPISYTKISHQLCLNCNYILVESNISWNLSIMVIDTDIQMQFPINPYGKAKKMAEDIILDFSKNSNMAVMILRSVSNSTN